VNIIKEFKESIDTDAPDIFQEAAILHSISFLLGRYFEFDFTPTKLNLWFILAGAPGITRKSTISKYNDIVIQQCLRNYFGRQQKPVQEIEDLLNLTNIQQGSKEGVIDKIVLAHNKGLNHMTVCDSEFGETILKAFKAGDYAHGINTLYSRLYYGEPYVMDLSMRTESSKKQLPRRIPEGMYVTMLSAMQEPYLYLHREMIQQGLLRRILLIYIKTTDMKMENWKSPITRFHKREETKLKTLANKISQFMWFFDKLYVDSGKMLNIEVVPAAKNMVTFQARKADERVRNDPSLFNLVKQSQWEYALKLSALYAINRGEWNPETAKLQMINIDVQQAFGFVTRINKNLEEVIDSLDIKRKVMEVDETIERILSLIKRKGEVGYPYSKLLMNCGLRANQLKSILETLVIRGQIKLVDTNYVYIE